MIEKKTKNHDLRKAAGHNSVPSKQTTLFCTWVEFSVEDIWKISMMENKK